MKSFAILILTLAFSFSVHAQQEKQNRDKKAEVGQMKTYYLVFLKKGPKRDQDSATSTKIQSGHMAHLNKMYLEEKMDLAGPMMNDGDIRGICVYNVASMEEAKKLAESDPAVVSGRLIVEILPWYSQKGAMLR